MREEMDAIGAQEVHFPALLPREPYEASGRWTDYGDNIFRLQDRKGADYLLGPTHEEMFTLLVKDLYSSYKDLPLSLYQIQTKYRDEPRPARGHPARSRVRDEGLVLLRRQRRGVPARPTRRTARPTSGSSTGSGSTTSSSRPCPARWAARRARSSWPLRRTARTPTSAAPTATTPPTSRRCGCRVPDPICVRRRAGRARRGHPGHADDRDAGRPPQREVPARRPAVDRRRTR